MDLYKDSIQLLGKLYHLFESRVVIKRSLTIKYYAIIQTLPIIRIFEITILFTYSKRNNDSKNTRIVPLDYFNNTIHLKRIVNYVGSCKSGRANNSDIVILL